MSNPSRVFLGSVGLALMLLVGSAWGAATVTGINQVSSTRVGRTTYDFSYTINVTNGSGALSSATATVTSNAAGTIIVQGTVSLGTLVANSSITSTNTFTLQQDRLVPFDPASLTWTVTGTPISLVPNVVGLAQAAASSVLSTAGLVLGAVTQQSSTTVATGNVISESPTAGTQVSAGSAVSVVVSSGAPKVAVPNLVGLSQSAASSALSTAGLVLGALTQQSSTTVATGNVISESPTAGTQVSAGSAVSLVVSTGTAKVSVPNVVGLSQSAASSALSIAGLVLGAVTQQASPSVATGNVISESPAAGAQVSAGSAVNLVVSTGTAQVSVPNVVGFSQSAASSALSIAGLVLGAVTQQASPSVATGNVISEAPVAGTQVSAGSAVNLVVSTGTAQVSVPNVVGLTQAAASSAITGAGLTIGTLSTASSSTAAPGNVVGESPAAGTQVNHGSAVNLVLSTQVAAAQGLINALVGGTISVTDPASPLLGTQVVVPVGALGDPADTITIGYASQLPAVFSVSATSHGILQVSPVVILSKAGATPLQNVVTVTIPYSTNILPAPDVPAVVFWDPVANEYHSLSVLSFDSAHGFVTFETKHFTTFTTQGEPGLVARLTNPQAPQPVILPSGLVLDTGFRPETDGFEARNFGTGLDGRQLGQNGLCFGISAYAVWYYDFARSSAYGANTPHLFSALQTLSDSTDSSLHVPQEDSVAREIMAWTYIDTINSSTSKLDDTAAPNYTPQLALQAVAQLVTELDNGEPQLLFVRSGTSPGGHSPVVYGYSITKPNEGDEWGFFVYDPNFPAQEVSPILWNPTNVAWEPWNNYDRFYFDSYSYHYDPSRLLALTNTFNSPEPGSLPPTLGSFFSAPVFSGGWFFNTLSISSALGQSASNTYPAVWPVITGTGPNDVSTLYVDPANGTTLTFTWNCPACIPLTAFLHVYQNETLQTVLPLGTTYGQVTVNTAPFAAGDSSNELFAFVSASSEMSEDSTDQSDLSPNYAGFQRVKLAPEGVTISVTTTVPGWVELPSTITLSGFYSTSVQSFQQKGDQGSTCLNSTVNPSGERGYPLFSSAVDPAATFIGTSVDTATPAPFPYTPTGPYPGYKPCSSFVAYDKPDANGNGKVWVNATGRGLSFNGDTGEDTDWEYQIRYYSGDPAKSYADASCSIGVVPNDNEFIGQAVACTVKCNAGLFGKVPSCQ